MKRLNISGQGVIEGVMIKGEDSYVIALRKGNDEIDYVHDEHKGVDFSFIGKIPLLRGVVALIDYIVLALKTMSHSVDFYEEDRREKPSLMERFFVSMFGSKGDEIMLGLITIISVIFSILIFIVVPYKAGDYLARHQFLSENRQLVAEATIRVLLFFAFLIFVSFRKDLRRSYKYHGAEHKVLNCLEHGESLNVENVKKYSKYRTSCCNNFLFYVAFVCIVAFAFIRTDDVWKLLGFRLAIIPIAAAVIFEFTRLSGKTNNVIVKLLNLPAYIIQRFVVKSPNQEMIEVAIAAVEAVFDWRTFIGENADNNSYASKYGSFAEEPAVAFGGFSNGSPMDDDMLQDENQIPIGASMNNVMDMNTDMNNTISLGNTMVMDNTISLGNTMAMNQIDNNYNEFYDNESYDDYQEDVQNDFEQINNDFNTSYIDYSEINKKYDDMKSFEDNNNFERDVYGQNGFNNGYSQDTGYIGDNFNNNVEYTAPLGFNNNFNSMSDFDNDDYNNDNNYLNNSYTSNMNFNNGYNSNGDNYNNDNYNQWGQYDNGHNNFSPNGFDSQMDYDDENTRPLDRMYNNDNY